MVVIDAEAEKRFEAPVEPATNAPALPQAPATGLLSSNLDLQRVIVWTEPVTRSEILRDVVSAAHRSEPALEPETALRLLQGREAQGSMFLNDGVALPHVRVPKLRRPLPVLGLVHGGVIDVTTEARPIGAGVRPALSR